ncbi:sulfatase-like hydrolase/transferase [Cochlodiniinecator piscidefendens]|uniref:sulfatase-like hydrolase/transferase n=1 Tax=Cochlodiniinecator piscidefendens TaxID=2715756 RepID=UPI00140A1A38|nr:sulfatase-like hydrolase/transferase [Cochlodiniinecator piscidefendens]
MTKQPNIVVIIADHVAFEGHYGQDRFEYRWPNLEKIAGKGCWFDKAYAITPICTPSRASFLTGKRPDKHGLRWNSEYPIPHNRRDFRADERLYCDALNDAGYDNYYYGKWHCGVNKTAQDYGLTGWSLPEYGNLYASTAYKAYLARIGEEQPRCRIDYHLLRPELNGSEVLMDPDEPWDFMDGAGVLLGSPEVQEQFFVANMAIDQLNEIARAPREEPFSMVISLWGPHHPYYPSQDYVDQIDHAAIPPYPSFDEDLNDKPWRYRVQRDLRCQHRAFERWPSWDIWQKVMGHCYAAGLQTDAAIGRIADCLADTGLDQDTLFIITADHGDGIAAHGAGWDKYSSFTEEIGRIPLVMTWPSHIPEGSKVKAPVNLLDVTATFLSAGQARVEHPLPLDGDDLLPLIKGETHRQSMICDHFGHSGDISFQKILYRDGWKYTACWGDDDELYDLNTDPFELNNLRSDTTTTQRQYEMRAEIIEHLEARRTERRAWKPAEFWEDGIVFSSPEWPREETLLLYKLTELQKAADQSGSMSP